MRPESAYTYVRKVMKKFYHSYDELPKDHQLLDKKFIKAVDVCLRVSKKQQLELVKEFPDIEISITTKAYYEIEGMKDILINLMYISDRWNCVGRLLYLKNVIAYLQELNYNKL